MNKVISMFYELKDADTGEILESNKEASEISFITGKNQILEKLEEEVLKLNIGDETNITISPADGLGDYDENALQTLSKEEFVGIDLKEGMELFGEAEDGTTTRVIVKKISDNDVVVDFNHPYAGKNLEFNVKITENRDATEDEILTGSVAKAHTCGCGSHSHEDHHHGNGGCCGRHH